MFMKGGDVSSAQARQLVQAGARLVDVRTPGELRGRPHSWRDQHSSSTARRSDERAAAKRRGASSSTAEVVNRSGSAARMLKSAGFAAVHDLAPMSRWWRRDRRRITSCFFEALTRRVASTIL